MSRIAIVLMASMLLAWAAGCVAPSQGAGIGAKGEKEKIEALLDEFHHAAAVADEDRYFNSFAPEAVYMGTDPEERWELAAFRAWALPYFQRDSAWIFEPSDRNLYLSEDQRTAWFDEVVESAHYGKCRGTGALRKVKGDWKITHYNLALPIPNDLMDEVVQRMAGKIDFLGEARAEDTLVILMRHAEKEDEPENPDPLLSEEGRIRAQALARLVRDLPVHAGYATQYVRTQRTVAPALEERGLEMKCLDAAQVDEMVRILKTDHGGECVLVSGHSNTVPLILKGLGVEEEVTIVGRQYSDLFMVLLRGESPPLFMHLHYGEK